MVVSDSVRQSRSPSSIDGDGYVFPPSWQGLKQQVIYLAQFGGGVQVVEGIAGAGKSTFAHWLADNQDDLVVPIIHLPAEAGAHYVFSELLQQLGLRPPASATAGELLVMLRRYVQSLHREGARAIALIDDAHRMDDSELAALTSIMQGESESGDGLHLILMAEPGLASRIDQLQLLDVAVHDAALPPLSPAEVEAMLMKRMAQPATQGGDELSQTLWNETGGIPGKILARLNASVELTQVSEPADVESAVSLQGWPIAHFVALIILCCTLLWAFFAKKQPNDLDVTNERSSVPAVHEKHSAEPEKPSLDTEVATSHSPVSTMAPKPQDVETKVADETKVASTGKETNVVEGGTVSVGSHSIPELPRTELTDDGEAEMEAAKAAVTPTSDSAAQPENEPASEPNAAVAEKVDASVPPVEPKRPNKSTAFAASNPQDLVAKSEAKLLDFPASAYVLQLMASSAPKELLDFLEAQPNRDNLMVYRAERNGRMLHILVEGFYADREAARAAIVNLPATQQKGGPWPTRIGHIHQDINANRRR